MRILLLGALVVLLCIWASRLSSCFGVPTLLIFIVLGMLFGSDGIVKIPLDNFPLVEEICSAALAFIMFYGGFGTNWNQAKPVAGKALVLSTLGVVLTALVTALFCYVVLRFDFAESLLIGAVTSSTDAASVFSILRAQKLNLKNNTASLLELESGSNDPASYMLTIAALSLLSGSVGKELAVITFLQIAVGILMGLFSAAVSIFVLSKKRLTVDGFNTLFVLAMVLFSYALTSLLNGNGYLSVYLFGILLGNSKIINKIPLVHFFDGVTGQAQIVIFFLLGLLSFPSRIPGIFPTSLAIALCLTFLARPAAVFAVLGPARCSLRQMLLVSFAGLRGAASIVFAIIALTGGGGGRWDLFHIVFCVCLLSVAFQGTLLPVAARKLDMVDDGENVMKTFNDYQDERQLQLVQSRVTPGHPWIGKEIGDLGIEFDVLVVMIIRGKQNLVPRGKTVIQEGDLIVLGGEPYWEEEAVALEEVHLDEQHPWVGQPIKALPLSEGELVVLLQYEDGTTAIPHGDTWVHEGDTLVIRRISTGTPPEKSD